MAFWTNKSVVALAAGEDPEATITEQARQLALRAMSEGWSGPPYDPFELAERLGIPVTAREDLYDARILLADGGELSIEYNPSRPRGRVRYSVAHELAHTLFPDVADQVRYRSAPDELGPDAWQLEMLCNIAAGELLMPAGTFPELTEEVLDVEHLMALRREFDVSTEALLLRVARLADQPAIMFASSSAESKGIDAPLHVDYSRPTRFWQSRLKRGARIPRGSVAYECTAVGYTARGDEEWPEIGDVHVEAVGAPPYPGQWLPRVLGIVRPLQTVTAPPRSHIEYLTGDATRPRGRGQRAIAHVVNDCTPNWGGAFARALRRAYPVAQEQFRAWAQEVGDLELGAVHFADVTDELRVATMVAQHGYGSSQAVRLRYDALRVALQAVACDSQDRNAAIHMPRVGAGMAGGDWSIIAELIETEVVARNVEVIVYSLPGSDWSRGNERTGILTLPVG